MTREVELNHLRDVTGDLEYPISRDETVARVEGVTLHYADGGEPLADVVSRVNVERFEDLEDLETEIFNNVPVEAVGEPGQSEGDA